mmetsp:Transcript_32181/g.90115  ORF Transcript_32181/g.90115 Transcript_32181/m.90115 type:complete len:249 (-) Transcript_32181:199-945(-)
MLSKLTRMVPRHVSINSRRPSRIVAVSGLRFCGGRFCGSDGAPPACWPLSASCTWAMHCWMVSRRRYREGCSLGDRIAGSLWNRGNLAPFSALEYRLSANSRRSSSTPALRPLRALASARSASGSFALAYGRGGAGGKHAWTYLEFAYPRSKGSTCQQREFRASERSFMGLPSRAASDTTTPTNRTARVMMRSSFTSGSPGRVAAKIALSTATACALANVPTAFRMSAWYPACWARLHAKPRAGSSRE